MICKFYFQAMNAKECDWENKNQMLQKELRDTLRSALEDTESEEHSLTSLEQVRKLSYSDVLVLRETLIILFQLDIILPAIILFSF